jgi:hypothetical protein
LRAVRRHLARTAVRIPSTAAAAPTRAGWGPGKQRAADPRLTQPPGHTRHARPRPDSSLRRQAVSYEHRPSPWPWGGHVRHGGRPGMDICLAARGQVDAGLKCTLASSPAMMDQICPLAGLRSGRYSRPGRSLRPVAEAADVSDTVAFHGEDLPALGHPACLASVRRPGDVQPHQQCPGTGGHLSDNRSCTGTSRAGPPGDDLISVAAVGIAGTLWRTPARTVAEQIPDRIKITGLQGGPDSSGQHGWLFCGAGTIWHEDLPRNA